MSAERRSILSLPLLLLLGSPGCFPAPAATEPAALPPLSMVLDTLAPGTSIRLALTQLQLSGRVLEVTADSLRLDRAPADTTIARAQIDTLWVQGSRSRDGTKAGAAAGLTLALLIVLAGHGGPQPESGGYGLLLAGYVVAGALGLGILVDVAAATPWVLAGVR